MRLEDRFSEHVAGVPLLTPGERIVLGCSGGADSVALVHLLAAARDVLGLGEVVVAHLDHALRPGSEGDAAFVRDLALSLGLRMTTARERPLPEAGESPEQAARRVRYGFLEASAREAGATAILVAHHLDDQAETVLYRALTGAGLRGIAGMSQSRPVSPVAPELRLVRPLLPFRRKELRAWLTGRGHTWREDPTNQSGNVRARLRNQAWPVLTACVGRDPAPLLARLASHAEEAAGELEARAAELLPGFLLEESDGVLLRPGFELLPTPWRKRALGAALREIRDEALPPTETELLRLLAILAGDTGETVRGVAVIRTGAGWRLTEDRPCADPEPFSHALQDGIATPIPGGGTVTLERTPVGTIAFLARLEDPSGRTELLDAAPVEGPLVLRSWVGSERFVPLGGGEPVRVRGYLARRGVAARERNSVPVVADAAGPLWIVGHGIADRARVRAGTRDVLLLRSRVVPPRK